MTALTVVEWNVHWGVTRVPGLARDARFDPLEHLDSELLRTADVVVFPEAWRGHDGSSFLDRCDEFGLKHVVETRYRTLAIGAGSRFLTDPAEGFWELAVASRHPIVADVEIPLAQSLRDVVPERRARAVRLAVGGNEVDVTAFHVSSKVWLGAPLVQLRSLARQLRERDLDGTNRPAVIAGDGNIWRTWIPALLPGWTMTAKGRTFPSWRPHSQIDHICVRGAVDVVSAEVLAYSPTSDHRAIRACLQLR